jgi:hypothetical protein
MPGSGAWGNASLILAVLHRDGLGRGAGFRGLYIMGWRRFVPWR